MSVDRQIDQVCPHIVIEEALFVEADRLTIRPLRPIGAAASVQVFLNHQFSVPSMGVALPAKSSGTREGPFTIQAGVNDTLVLSVNQRPAQTVVLPVQFQASTAQIVNLLNRQISDVFFFVVNRKVAFQTKREGLSESIFISAASTLADTLGIQKNREYRGQQNIPGWTLVGDPATLADRPTRLVIFDEPLRSGTDFVEINYTTIRQECRRCGGSGVENDWRYDLAGEVIGVRDEPLLIQELQKDFYTIRGSNPFHTWYGTELLDMVGKKLSSGGFIQNFVVSDIYQAFARWQSIKQQQEEKVGQFVSDKEFPFRLLAVELEQSAQDPTVVFVNMTIQNRSSDPIQLSRGLRVPQPADLLGSTAQAGVARQAILTG